MKDQRLVLEWSSPVRWKIKGWCWSEVALKGRKSTGRRWSGRSERNPCSGRNSHQSPEGATDSDVYKYPPFGMPHNRGFVLSGLHHLPVLFRPFRASSPQGSSTHLLERVSLDATKNCCRIWFKYLFWIQLSIWLEYNFRFGLIINKCIQAKSKFVIKPNNFV